MSTAPDRINVVNIRPDDCIVIHYERFLTPEQRLAIRASLSQEFETDKVVIMEGGLQLGVVRQGQEDMIPRSLLKKFMTAVQKEQTTYMWELEKTEVFKTMSHEELVVLWDLEGEIHNG